MKELNNETVTYRGHRATGIPGPPCRKRAKRQAVGTAKELQDSAGRQGEQESGKMTRRTGNERGYGRQWEGKDKNGEINDKVEGKWFGWEM